MPNQHIIVQLNNLGFKSAGDIMNSDGFKNYVRKDWEEENKHIVSDGTYLLNHLFKGGIPKDKISMIVGQSNVGRSYYAMIPYYVRDLLRLKKLQKIQSNIKK